MPELIIEKIEEATKDLFRRYFRNNFSICNKNELDKQYSCIFSGSSFCSNDLNIKIYLGLTDASAKLLAARIISVNEIEDKEIIHSVRTEILNLILGIVKRKYYRGNNSLLFSLPEIVPEYEIKRIINNKNTVKYKINFCAESVYVLIL